MKYGILNTKNLPARPGLETMANKQDLCQRKEKEGKEKLLCLLFFEFKSFGKIKKEFPKIAFAKPQKMAIEKTLSDSLRWRQFISNPTPNP